MSDPKELVYTATNQLVDVISGLITAGFSPCDVNDIMCIVMLRFNHKLHEGDLTKAVEHLVHHLNQNVSMMKLEGPPRGRLN